MVNLAWLFVSDGLSISETTGPVFINNLNAKSSSVRILRKFLEMWVFTLKIEEKILVKKKSNSESIFTLKRGLKVKIVRSMDEDF